MSICTSNVFTVSSLQGKEANVSGMVYFNGKPLESKTYDAVLWCAIAGDESAVTQDEFKDKKVLVIFEKDFSRALAMKELGYGG